MGDFNAIKENGERRGRGSGGDRREIEDFKDFLDRSKLVDLPLCGSNTWFRDDGSCKSRLDRVLVNEQWLSKWRQITLRAGGRSISDHRLIFTEEGGKDWGPKPFRFINSWTKHEKFKDFVQEKW